MSDARAPARATSSHSVGAASPARASGVVISTGSGFQAGAPGTTVDSSRWSSSRPQTIHPHESVVGFDGTSSESPATTRQAATAGVRRRTGDRGRDETSALVALRMAIALRLLRGGTPGYDRLVPRRLAIGHIITAFSLAITLIGIPLGLGNLKLVPTSLWPVGREIVPATQVEAALATYRAGPSQAGAAIPATGGPSAWRGPLRHRAGPAPENGEPSPYQ